MNKTKTHVLFKTTLKHFFTDHLTGDTTRDSRLKAIKIYYTQKVANNPHLAHFLLFDSMITGSKEGSISKVQRLVNLMYLDAIITDNKEKEEKQS